MPTAGQPFVNIRFRVEYSDTVMSVGTQPLGKQQNADSFGFSRDSLISHKPSRTLYARQVLIVPHRVTTVTASRAFRVAALTIWNNLPNIVKEADSFNVFKRRLKYHIFDALF